MSEPAMLISIVIPARQEAQSIGRLLAELARESEPHEVIVVDAASTDATAEIARAAGARVLLARYGRGAQLAAGAAAAHGDILLFLHADARFPCGGLRAIRAALDRSAESPGGNFRLLFDGEEPFSRWLGRFYAFIRRAGLMYGDSGIFVRHAAYARAGGFRPLEVMEDHDFVGRLKRIGPLINIADPPLVTSSRRFAGRRPAEIDRKSTRLNSSHIQKSRMPSSA